jgi:hypothetical protein
MAYTPGWMSSAERRRFNEIPQANVPALTALQEISNPTSLTDADTRRYAQIVQNIEPSGGLSGDLGFYTLEYFARRRRTAELSGLIAPAFATVVESDGDMTWVAEATAGTPLSSSTWRIKQVQSITQGLIETTEVTWLDDNGSFDNNVVFPLSSLF